MQICAVAPCWAPSYRRTLTLLAARTAACSRVQLAGTGRVYSLCAASCCTHPTYSLCAAWLGYWTAQHLSSPRPAAYRLQHCSAAALQNTELVSAAALSIEKIVIFGSRSNTTINYKNYSFISLSSTQQYNNTIIAGWMAGLHLNHTHIDNLFS